MVDTPTLQPAPSLSADTCVHAATRPAAAESVSSSLDLIFGPRGQGGSEETVVAADDQINCNHLLHVTLIFTNNHTTIKSTQSHLVLPPKLDKKGHSLRRNVLPGSVLKHATPFTGPD